MVDIDISKRRRGEMIDIAVQLFGEENVFPISTFNTLSTKVAIRDIGKVMNNNPDSPYFQRIPYATRDSVAKLIPSIKKFNDEGEEIEIDIALTKALKSNPKLQDIYEQYPLWFKYVMDLEGLPKSRGQHASAIMITPVPAIRYSPLCKNKDGESILQMEMHALMDDIKLIKMDFLGLDTLDIIDDTLRMSNMTWDDVDINHLNLEDDLVYDTIYKTGETIGIFQMESLEGRRMNVQAQSSNVEDVIAINAFNRPGTKDGFPIYVNNKLGGTNELVHPDLEPIFAQSQGVLLYQEQALQIFRYAGFPEPEVDNARRAIGKKDAEQMATLKVKFASGLLDKKWNEQQIDEIWALMEKQAEYSFNRSHAVAYGLISYLTAYLKTHFPLQFMTACLISKSGTQKLSLFINEAKEMGIKVSPPHINKSSYDFTCIPEQNEILFGFFAIKGLGKNVIDDIISVRPFTGINDFLSKVTGKAIIITLAKAGALPVKNKREFLIKYAKSTFNNKPYTPVKTVSGSQAKIYELYGLDFSIIKDKEERLKLLNEKKEIEYKVTQQEKYEKHMNKFAEQYLQDEYMWEFQTLSMFITNDPLKEAYEYVTPWNEVEDGGTGVLLCVITQIQRRKDRRGNTYAYVDLYTPFGIVESTCWGRQLNKYNDLVKKGNSVAVLCQKQDTQAIIEEVKPYKKWLTDRKIEQEGV